MAEKEEGSYDVASTVMVDAIETVPSNTVGAAIDILEEKLANKGISLQYPPITRKSDMGKVDGKLLCLPTLIHLAIIYGIDTTERANEKSVGEVTDCVAETLVAGNVVALFGEKRGFLCLDGETAEFGRYENDYELPLEWDSKHFLVVDAGYGYIAFYSPTHRRFLGLKGGSFSALGHPLVNAQESPRANESFQVKHHGIGSFSLFCPIENAAPTNTFSVVKLYGFD